MPHYCPHCAVELIEGSKFCSACGKEVDQPIVNDKKAQTQKKEEQLQASVPLSTSQKSRKKLIIGILAIIIAVVIALVAIVYLLGGTSSFTGADGRFVGEWEQNSIEGPLLWKFNSNSTLETESSSGVMNNVGKWNVKDTQICLYNNAVCYTYVFSNNGKTLTLNIVEISNDYLENIVLTKKGEQEINLTPDIKCSINTSTNRLTITSTNANTKWRDIVITTDPDSANWEVFNVNDIALAKINITATITTDVTVGDYIILLDAMGDVKVTLKYLPTNSLLGTWTINV
jgi:hypothetical protein